MSQNTQETTCASLFFNNVAGNIIQKETLTQVFSYEFREIFKNSFSKNAPGQLLLWVISKKLEPSFPTFSLHNKLRLF